MKEKSIFLLVAAMIGIIAGALCAFFGRVLLAITAFRSSHVIWLLPFLGVAGALTIFAYQKISKESLKGMGLVMKVGFGEEEKIPILLIPLIIFGTWLSHLFGGSAGREGVAVQLGATIANNLGRAWKIKGKQRILVLTGMAAGFAGLFQTPLTAVFFAMEVMVAGVVCYDALFPAMIAAWIASTTSHLLGLEKFSVVIPGEMVWNVGTIVKVVIIAIVFGVVGGGFAFLLKNAKKKVEQITIAPIKRIFLIGSLLAVLFLVLHMGRYSGLGTNLIAASFDGKPIYWYDWALKVLLTVATLAVGYQGGEVTPLFSIGASLGIVLATIFGLPLTLVAA